MTDPNGDRPLLLCPGQATLAQLERVYRDPDLPVRLDEACRAQVHAAHQIVQEAAAGDVPVYGVNTGFGKLASVRIPAAQTAELQRNLVLSHCCGVGEPLDGAVVRLIIALKLLSLGRGASGVRWEVLELLEGFLRTGLVPLIPAQGSVGASGDLAPLAHLAAVMIGEGEAFVAGQPLPGARALERVGLRPLVLGPKEGLGLINGTQVSTALALGGLFEGWRLAQTALVSGALVTDALMDSTAPFHPAIHDLRGLRGQRDAAASLRGLLEGSMIRESHREGDDRVQDPYSIRCQPQVMGACLDQLRQAAATLEVEANAVTDNPIVVVEEGAIVSGGNFHAEPVALAADQLALAFAEIGAITERRIAITVDPAQSFGLPAFLTPAPGLNSGFMIAEVTCAALMAENRHLANPCSVDSTPTSANQEDHVSMACHAARRLTPMARNLTSIVAVELLLGAQGVEFRAPMRTSAPLQWVLAQVRARVSALQEDRYLAGDIAAISDLVRAGAIVGAPDVRRWLPELDGTLVPR
ncbi:MAG: histidine ammonia-lyase [Pseudomonadota bacterium]